LKVVPLNDLQWLLTDRLNDLSYALYNETGSITVEKVTLSEGSLLRLGWPGDEVVVSTVVGAIKVRDNVINWPRHFMGKPVPLCTCGVNILRFDSTEHANTCPFGKWLESK